MSTRASGLGPRVEVRGGFGGKGGDEGAGKGAWGDGWGGGEGRGKCGGGRVAAGSEVMVGSSARVDARGGLRPGKRVLRATARPFLQGVWPGPAAAHVICTAVRHYATHQAGSCGGAGRPRAVCTSPAAREAGGCRLRRRRAVQSIGGCFSGVAGGLMRAPPPFVPLNAAYIWSIPSFLCYPAPCNPAPEQATQGNRASCTAQGRPTDAAAARDSGKLPGAVAARGAGGDGAATVVEGVPPAYGGGGGAGGCEHERMGWVMRPA
jgi:hypothetical protein